MAFILCHFGVKNNEQGAKNKDFRSEERVTSKILVRYSLFIFFLLKQLQDILSQFPLADLSYTLSPISAGHINDSYWVQANGQRQYVLQRINHQIFTEPVSLGNNLQQVSAYTKSWTEKHYPKDSSRRFVQFIPTRSGENQFHAEDGYWRLMIAIQNSLSYDFVEEASQANEAGRLFGEFWVALSELSPTGISPTIDRFHDLQWRWEQLQHAFQEADEPRQKETSAWVQAASELMIYLQPVLKSIHSGTLPLRIVHNDAKLSNALFDKHTQEGLCVIDLDTVMPGYLLYDFGDMVRSMCCPVAEDDPNTAAVSCDMTYFEALAQGYLQASASHITAQEIESLVLSGTYMSLIMGMRFLADYLQGSIYYKTTYPTHNFDRARNQITLAQDLMRREKQLHSTLRLFL